MVTNMPIRSLSRLIARSLPQVFVLVPKKLIGILYLLNSILSHGCSSFIKWFVMPASRVFDDACKAANVVMAVHI